MPDPIYREVLRLIRVYHDLNQKLTAEKLGISTSHLCEIENGRKAVTLGLMAKYSIAFEIPVLSILLLAERINNGLYSDTQLPYVGKKTLKLIEWANMVKHSKRS